METITAITTSDEVGPLAKIVLDFGKLCEQNATASGSTANDWEALGEFVAVDEFTRTGAYLEEFTWPEYVRFLTEWAGSTRFETTTFRVVEAGNVVLKSIEERHWHGDEFIRKNVFSVFVFNDENKIVHIDIYEQAKDSGQWIVQAAGAATTSS